MYFFRRERLLRSGNSYRRRLRTTQHFVQASILRAAEKSALYPVKLSYIYIQESIPHCLLKQLIHPIHNERMKMIHHIVLALQLPTFTLVITAITLAARRNKRNKLVREREHARRTCIELLAESAVERAMEGQIGRRGQRDSMSRRLESGGLELGIVLIEAGGGQFRDRTRGGSSHLRQTKRKEK